MVSGTMSQAIGTIWLLTAYMHVKAEPVRIVTDQYFQQLPGAHTAPGRLLEIDYPGGNFTSRPFSSSH